MGNTWADVAAAVTERRADLDLTQQQAAALAGVSATTWQKLEARHEAPNERSLRKMARVLGWPATFAETILSGEVPQEVEASADAPTSEASDVVGIAALAGELTPEDRAKVEAYMRGLLDGKKP